MPKKQTVWLFAMMSITAVLGVYYVTGPEKLMPVATLEPAVDEAPVVEELPKESVFEMIRLEAEEERSRIKEELTAEVASADATPEEKEAAYMKIEELDEQAAAERMLETVIQSKGYEDVLVRTIDGTVHITVQAEKHSAAEANDLIQIAKQEMGSRMPVSVEFEPLK